MNDITVTKRALFRAIATAIPTLEVMGQTGGTARVQQPQADGKFTSLDFSRLFNASREDFQPRDAIRRPSVRQFWERTLLVPAGNQTLRGIPFLLGPSGFPDKAWLALRRGGASWTTQQAEVVVGKKASHLCLAQFCDWDETERDPASVDVIEKVGQPLAEVTLLYEDGTRHLTVIRRRFEVHSVDYPFGHLCFAALPHRQETPVRLNDSMAEPGAALSGTTNPNRTGAPTLWLSALPNPSPEKVIRAVRFESVAEDVLFVCGATVFHGRENPLRPDRLTLFRFVLPESDQGLPWEVSVDLGVVARTYKLPQFEPSGWLASPTAGLGELPSPLRASYLYAEVSATPDATLTLRNTKTGRRFEFNLADVVPGRELEAHPTGAGIEVLEKEKVWLRAKVIDTATRKPTPVRLAFRSKDGRYIPPYGHRTEIQTVPWQGCGGDLRQAASSFSYVDGVFQVELPVGEVYLEMTKGFEYKPIRQRLAIQRDQSELNLEISPFVDLRSKNWVTADTHVHVLSPSTAVLEGQAEGVNLINLLAVQLGEHFPNVGDLSHGPITSNDGGTIVWVGTENRHHILGHLGLLGGKGPVFPMSGDGPPEGYIGTPLWNSLADWAEASRERGGLAIAAHFPYPGAELIADIVLGKIDAVELINSNGNFSPMSQDFGSLRFRDWYRALNCGYKLPAVGGTDKMGSSIAVGASRAYAHLGQDEFGFESWAKAVRRGNTFVSSGPLLLFQADGRVPGDEIRMGTGGGRIEVAVDMHSTIPVHRIDIIWNGKTVVTREETAGAGTMSLRETISVSGPGWLAARCSSRFVSVGQRVAAHTSPIYVTIPGKDLFSAPVASYMLTIIDGAESWVKNLATRPDQARFARAVKIYSEAREHLHRRMHQHGIAH